jgi:hypothetical protein
VWWSSALPAGASRVQCSSLGYPDSFSANPASSERGNRPVERLVL